MNVPAGNIVQLFFIFITIMFVTGLYYILVTRNLIRILLGFEILAKAVTIAIAVAGFITGRSALAQSFIITFIIIEVAVVVVYIGIILSIYQRTDSIDTGNVRNLKG